MFKVSLRPMYKFSSKYGFPYNFEGFKTNWSNKSDEFIQAWVTSILDEKIENGFKFAFNNLTQALASEEPLKYIEENCEDRLAQRFREALSEMEQDKNQLIAQKDSDVKQEIRFSEMTFHIGLGSHESVVNNFDCKKHKFKENLSVKIYPRRPRGAVLQIDMEMRTKYNLNFINRPIDVPDNLIHRVVFRTQNDGPFENLSMTNIMSILMKRKDGSSIQSFLFGKDYRWIIADVDQSQIQ